jgi:hypothetical protein
LNTSGYQEGTVAWYVARAFGDEATPGSDEFLRELRTNWREALERARQVGVQLVLLFALFALLVDANVSEIAFAGVKLRAGAVELIATALPALIAYNFAKYWELYMLTGRYETLHVEICRQLHPALAPLDKALHPPETYDSDIYEIILLESEGGGKRGTQITNAIAQLVGFILPFVFVIGCYVALLELADPSELVFIASGLVAGFFLLRTVSFLLAATNLHEEAPAPLKSE